MKWGKQSGGFALIGGLFCFLSLVSSSRADFFPKEAQVILNQQPEGTLFRKGWGLAQKKFIAGDSESAQFAMTFAVGSLLPKDGNIPSNRIRNREHKKQLLTWLYNNNQTLFRKISIDWIQAQRLVIDAVYGKMMDPETFSDRSLVNLSWKRNGILQDSKNKVNANLSQLISTLQFADRDTLIQFQLEKGKLFLKISEFVESIMGRYQSAGLRADLIDTTVRGFYNSGQFRIQMVADEVNLNHKISEMDLNENLLRVWVNRQTITATALSVAILAEGIAMFFTAGATAGLLPTTLAALQATANGIVIGSSMLNLADRVSVAGLSGLWNLESLMDGLVVIGLSSALMPKGFATATKAGAVIAKVQKSAVYGLTVLFPSLAAYEFANAAAIAKQTGRDIGEVRRTAVIHLGIGVLGGIPVFAEVRNSIKNRASLNSQQRQKLADVENSLGVSTPLVSKAVPTSFVMEEVIIQAGQSVKLRNQIRDFQHAVKRARVEKTEVSTQAVLSEAEVVLKESGVRFSRVKVEGFNCLKIGAFSGLSYLNTLAFNLVKKMASTELVFCPGFLVNSGAEAIFMSPVVGETIAPRVMMSFDAVAGSKMESLLAHEVNHAYFYKLRSKSLESPFDVAFFGKMTDDPYSAYFSSSELSTYALELAIDTASARKAILAGKKPDVSKISNSAKIGNTLASRAVEQTRWALEMLSNQGKNPKSQVVSFQCVRLPSGNLAAQAKVKLSNSLTTEVLLFSKEAVLWSQRSGKDLAAYRSLVATLEKKLESDLVVFSKMRESFSDASHAVQKWELGKQTWSEELKRTLLVPRENARKHAVSENTSALSVSVPWFEFILSYFRRRH